MSDSKEMPQELLEHVEDTLETFRDEVNTPIGRDLLRHAISVAFTLGRSQEAQDSIEVNEHIFDTMQEISDRRNVDGADLMAFLLLINEYEGTDAQTDDGRIFTTLNLAAVGPKLAGYEWHKFWLPNGDVEYQVTRKGGKSVQASTTRIEPEEHDL